MKNMPDTFSIDYSCLQIPPFETVILLCFWSIPRNKICKHAQENIFLIKIPKILCVFMVWKHTFYGKVNLSLTCQCRLLKLNPLSTQILKHLLSNDQSNACIAGATRSVNASCSYVITVPLYFCPLPPEL